MATIRQDLGGVTAYTYAVAGGYVGTEEEFEALLGKIAEDLSEIENLTVTVTGLPAGSSPTASYSDGVLALGIPKGDKGDQGIQGETGATGATGNGISSIAKTSTVGLVDTYTITYTNGNTTTFEVHNGTAEVDDTLTIQGAAADAKKTGDEISDLKSAFANHETRIVLLENIEKDRGLTKEEIVEIVTSGQADKYFQVGEQIACTWNDGSNEYDFPWDIVAIRDVVNENDHVVPGMILQAHWLVPGVQFDSSEAIYVVPEGETLPAGTYHITMGVNWGTHVVSGKSYNFTTTQTLQAGGQILFSRSGSNRYTWGAPDNNPSTWVCYTYASNADDTPLETLTLTEGTNGTSLGSVNTSTKYSDSGLNNLQRAAYGYNRDKMSAIRQFLNSDEAAGAWWSPQNPFDRTPQQLASMRGFMAGLPADFLDMINKVKITTALNTVSDSQIGTSESYYDKFFLPSLEEEYCVPQLSGVEGAYWPYWKDRLGLDSPQASGSANANPNHIRYLASNHASAAGVRLRSAGRGSAYNTWYVTSTGYVHYSGTATYALASAPACVICSSE